MLCVVCLWLFVCVLSCLCVDCDCCVLFVCGFSCHVFVVCVCLLVGWLGCLLWLICLTVDVASLLFAPFFASLLFAAWVAALLCRLLIVCLLFR